ncbi:MAG TPA: sulfite exporter TauE/SafE family protein [Candidatus Acidoferrales bacterium]|nr:sulfite exporter TauE/SafE family protein [Candidatus Acidoferrales bacterium]
MDLLHAGIAFGAAFLAGAINSVAGGGTLVSFPALIWLGLNSVAANATSTVAIWPGTVGSAWGYRRELGKAEPRFRVLIAPSLIGGLTGALLLRWTPPAIFDKLVPFLILFATLLLMAQEPVQRMLGTGDAESHHSTKWIVGALLFQLGVGIYGGYFGAGIGILMLAALSILGLQDIHEMNSLKVVFGGSINGIAAVYFVWANMVKWQYVLLMAVAAILGGWGGAGTARKMGRTAVRRIVIAIGFGMAISLFVKK